MTPREKEIALEAVGRSSDPALHAKRLLEARAVLHGQHAPFVLWPTGENLLDYQQKAAWHEEQAAKCRQAAIDLASFMPGSLKGDL